VAQGITVDPSGKFVYLTMGNNVLVYSINSTTGAVTSGGSATAGTSPISVVVEPKGKFAYVANFGSNNVSAFSIDSATGALTSLGAPTPAGNSPRSITVDPAGKFVYVANMGSGPPPAAGTISAYSINPTSGALNSLGGPVPAGSTPYAIVTTRTQ
jgi:DNA-binding beta-propeller fold protein YncE